MTDEQAVKELALIIHHHNGDSLWDRDLRIASIVYEAGYRLPEQTKKQLDPPPRFDEVYYQGLKHMNEGEQTDEQLRESIGAMVMDGNYYYIEPKTREIVIDCYVPNNRIAF